MFFQCKDGRIACNRAEIRVKLSVEFTKGAIHHEKFFAAALVVSMLTVL